ncbi:hypothetical protein DBV15_00388 [Temnothorax longispinosus]|uniref:Uncharacterized protein n=1 Tax=Temnothorax longispinosus TaxID=300112 RepID=A0A4S2JVS5_9HYME|nr:hypothetical protein DBV15_00388 [Temnothorax longispinosus]
MNPIELPIDSSKSEQRDVARENAGRMVSMLVMVLTCPSFSSFRLLESLSRSGVRLRNFSGGETERWPSLSSGRAIGLRSSGVSAAARCCCRSAGFSSACACAWTAAAAAGCGGGAKCGGTPAAAAAAAAPAKPSRPPGGRPPTTAPWGSCCAWICCCDVKFGHGDLLRPLHGVGHLLLMLQCHAIIIASSSHSIVRSHGTRAKQKVKDSPLAPGTGALARLSRSTF